MRMYDLIEMKKENKELTKQQIQWMIEEYVKGNIADYQMSSFLMAVWFNGMTDQELSAFTMAMAVSGDMINLSIDNGIKVDKHSTGGVGDKTTLITGPIVASCGVKVAKMSGRGLGHTGGTIDKLESIPGYRVMIPNNEFFDIINKVGISVIGQSGNLAPADKKLYALRDVTATVDSIPLIAASIMSKKLAAGSDCILLDVKMGSGAFMKTEEGAVELSKKMVAIGCHEKRKTAALITNMDIPLGKAIGNSLEVMEAIEVLRGEGPQDLIQVSFELAANMLYLAGKGDLQICNKLVKEAVSSGRALNKLKEMVKAHGGDVSVIENSDNFQKAPVYFEIIAPASGYINSMNTEEIGRASVLLGAGRETITSEIDYTAGIRLHKKTGEYVEADDVIATLYSSSFEKIGLAEKVLKEAYDIRKEASNMKTKLIYARVTSEGVEKWSTTNEFC